MLLKMRLWKRRSKWGSKNLRDNTASENKSKEVRRAIAEIPSAASLGTTVPRTCGVIELSTAVAA